MPLRGSHLVAFAIAAAIGGWMWQGEYMEGGQGAGDAETIAEREAKRDAAVFSVRIATVSPTERIDSLLIRGRTEADTRVEVKSETAGTLRERRVAKGDLVGVGDVLCVIDRGTRGSNVRQAEAALAQAQEDYEANRQLLERGFTTRSRVRALKTALDSAQAALDQAREEVGRTEIVAPVSGRVQDPIAEQGDVLRVGDTCVTLVDYDPMMFVGQISERDIGKVKVGMPTRTKLVDGREIEGEIAFIAPTADAATRTFLTEIALPNADGSLMEGVSAEAYVGLDPIAAYKLQSSWLTLSDDGALGVRTVDGEDKVRFRPVRIVAQTGDGVWVDGLDPGTRVIALGQNFVADGETVKTVDVDEAEEPRESAALAENDR